MSEKVSLLVVLGARPNFVKAAPFFKRALAYPQFELTLVHTGQHFDANMSNIFFTEMGIPKPHIQLDIRGEFHTEKIGKMFSALKGVIAEGNYDGVVVFGDINSALAGAIAAATHGKKIVHIESGLRSHDRRMPEEINRAIIDHIAHALFVTEESGKENLIREGIPEERIHVVGNIMIESIEMFRDHFHRSPIHATLGVKERSYVVTTIHRQENTDDPRMLDHILTILGEVAENHRLVMPLHPGTRQKIAQYGLSSKLEPLTVTEPLGYIDFMKLVLDAQGVVTDSGGIQEETTHLGIPCCTLRDNTERPVTTELGSNKLFPLHSASARDMSEHLGKKDFAPACVPLWDGQVSDDFSAHFLTCTFTNHAMQVLEWV